MNRAEYKIDTSSAANCEGWRLKTDYNPEKDLTVNKEKFYILEDPNPDPNADCKKAARYVLKELGYIDEKGFFHYYPKYQN